MRFTNPQDIYGNRFLTSADLDNPFTSIKKQLTTNGDVYCEITTEELRVRNFDEVELIQAHVKTESGLSLIIPDLIISEDGSSARVLFFTHEDDWSSYITESVDGSYECILTFYTRSKEGAAMRHRQVMDSPVQGYPVIETSDTEIPMVNGNWYKSTLNDDRTLTVIPAPWENRVATCFIDTSAVINIQGVQWLYGVPTLVSGNRHIIALQQIDADTILANLAVVI